MLKKALLGGKLRRLRQERALTQGQMASQLGISPSYLNLIEHDQRPVTVALLLKLGKTFDIDLQELSDDDERRMVMGLREVFAEASLGAEIKPEEIKALIDASPAAVKAVLDLHRAYRGARDDAQAMSLDLPGGKRRIVLPTEEASDFFHDRANHFAALEEAAESLAREARLGEGERAGALERALAERHAITVVISTATAMGGALRRYDAKARLLSLSEALARPSRVFQLAYQLGFHEARGVIDRLIGEAKLETQEAATLCRVGLANYVAGALLMPYAEFHAAAAGERHDVEALCHRFGVSFEQACHRLTTLQRPGAKGVPFFLVRVDIAGNIAKRLSSAGFHFSRFGGSCPRLVVHDCFTTPGRIRPQIARLPDGKTFLVVARTLEKDSGAFKEPRSQHAIAIGCDIAHARALVYADGHDLASLDGVTEIGVGCRLCERANCRQRAFPPLQHRLVVDEQVKGVSAYRFEIK